MKIHQIRNATLNIEYAGIKFLIDPMLSPRGTLDPFPGSEKSQEANPTVDLVTPMNEILDVDAVVVTHTHPDHWDEAAQKHIPKRCPIFAQHENDAELISSSGFLDVRILDMENEFGGVSLTRAPGQHGTDQAMDCAGEFLGDVCGIVFKHAEEQTLYLASDTIWNEQVRANLEMHHPDVIVLNCGDARIRGLGSIIMNKEDVYEVHRAAPGAMLIASHMEAVNLCVLSRDELRDFSRKKGMTRHLIIPEDGELFQSPSEEI